MMLSFILILTKTAVIIIKVNKNEATDNNTAFVRPTSNPKPPISCKQPNKIR